MRFDNIGLSSRNGSGISEDVKLLTHRPPTSWLFRQAIVPFSEVRFVRGSSLNNLQVQQVDYLQKNTAEVIIESP